MYTIRLRITHCERFSNSYGQLHLKLGLYAPTCRGAVYLLMVETRHKRVSGLGGGMYSIIGAVICVGHCHRPYTFRQSSFVSPLRSCACGSGARSAPLEAAFSNPAAVANLKPTSSTKAQAKCSALTDIVLCRQLGQLAVRSIPLFVCRLTKKLTSERNTHARAGTSFRDKDLEVIGD